MPYEIFCSTKVLWLPVFHLHIRKTFAGFVSPALKLLEVLLIIIQTFAKKNLRFVKSTKNRKGFVPWKICYLQYIHIQIIASKLTSIKGAAYFFFIA